MNIEPYPTTMESRLGMLEVQLIILDHQKHKLGQCLPTQMSPFNKNATKFNQSNKIVSIHDCMLRI